MSDDKKLNEMDFDEPRGIMNKLAANNLSFGSGNLRLSLTGGGMDFFIKSGYDGDNWTWNVIKPEDFTKNGKIDKEALTKARKGIVEEVESLEDKALEDIQEIIDAYMTLLEARMRKFDQDKQNLKKKYGQ